ncbi:hypothetical protein GCM10009867_07830 [Pedococcus aerophilus]|uniref:Uncharacterized protein n=1 Tax=Pedococcus aerophilus TaxID=436356 RepID=A0ABN3UGH4_9MICO
MPVPSPGSLAGNPPPRWGAPGEDQAHGTCRAQARETHHVSRTVSGGGDLQHPPSVTDHIDAACGTRE